MPLLDRFLQTYQVRSAHQIDINADVNGTYTALMSTDFADSAVVRWLMRLRRFGRRLKRPPAGSLIDHLQRSGFLLLEHEPHQHIVAGIAGKFWRPDSGFCADLRPEEFCEFRRPGFAKAAWLLEIIGIEHGRTRLRTETRVQCFGKSAELRFRAYWFLVGPFSGMMRTSMLQLVKRRAENTGTIKT
jgi:hypothetical protein